MALGSVVVRHLADHRLSWAQSAQVGLRLPAVIHSRSPTSTTRRRLGRSIARRSYRSCGTCSQLEPTAIVLHDNRLVAGFRLVARSLHRAPTAYVVAAVHHVDLGQLSSG